MILVSELNLELQIHALFCARQFIFRLEVRELKWEIILVQGWWVSGVFTHSLTSVIPHWQILLGTRNLLGMENGQI